jgi:hypothetical protein
MTLLPAPGTPTTTVRQLRGRVERRMQTRTR